MAKAVAKRTKKGRTTKGRKAQDQYAWTAGALMAGLAGDPAPVGRELRRLCTAHGKQLTATDVFEAARASEKSPLRPYFEWDRAKGWYEHNLYKARKLLRYIVIIPAKEPTRRYRIFTNVKVNEHRAYVYMPEAIKDEKLQQDILADAKRELGNFSRKYKDLQELAGVLAAIDEFLD